MNQSEEYATAQRAGEVGLRECPVCGEPYALASDGVPYHLTCSLDDDHEVCDPDDAHIPA